MKAISFQNPPASLLHLKIESGLPHLRPPLLHRRRVLREDMACYKLDYTVETLTLECHVNKRGWII